MGNHTNVLGKCLNNPDTLRAVLVVCPVCKTEGSGSGIVRHMDEAHQMVPDYANAQWVGRDGRNLEGRLLSQPGEDLTEAYSYQPPVPGVDETLAADDPEKPGHDPTYGGTHQRKAADPE